MKTKTDQGVSFNILISNRRLGCTALDKGFLCVLKLKLGLNFSEKKDVGLAFDLNYSSGDIGP